MKTRILPLLALLPFAACSDIEAGGPGAEPAAVTASQSPLARPTDLGAPVAATAITPVRMPAPVTSGSLDPLSPPPVAEGIAIGEPAPIPAAAVVTPPAPAGRLGTTVASLGSPTNPGLWLETPLVSEPTQGRVEYNGQSVSLELRPSGGEPGSGSQISLEAMRALGAPLTGLPELSVFSG